MQRFALALVLVAAITAPAAGALGLPAVFSDDMVLQRHQPVRVWGAAAPGERVTVTFADQEHRATADDAGRWQVTLDPLAASAEGRPLRVAGADGVVSVENVLVGEVWLGSGQSNMEWTMAMIGAERDIAAADDPHLRLFTVERAVADEPQADVAAALDWSAASPETVRDFSAVAYYFGVQLRERLDVPVGVIASSWGGTPAEAWTPLPALEVEPRLEPLLDRWGRRVAANPDDADHSHRPANLYNAMIAPLSDLTLRGFIWYQGESNVPRAHQYRTLFPLMIESWRRAFGRGDVPFLFVQIAPFHYHEAWNLDPAMAPELWEAQLLTLRAVPNTGMAVTTDISMIDDIHPTNKADVGRRLAAWALAYTYGNASVTPSGPIYTHHAIDEDVVRLHFDYADGLRSSDGQPLSHFTVAGADGEFHEATAEVDGETLRVRSDAVPHPVAVRFAWHDSAEPNLVNGAGLPASPFRTDSFPALTRDSH